MLRGPQSCGCDRADRGSRDTTDSRLDRCRAGFRRGFVPEAHSTAAEFDAGAALGFGARKTGALEIVSAMLNVGAQLVFYLGVHLRTMEESGDAEAKQVKEFHASSDCAASAVPIAVARRFQLSVSTRRRLRPATVSS